MVDQVLFSSKKTEWRTPQWLFHELDEEFRFELDAAADEQSALCACFFDEEDNALKQKWHPHRTVYCNPPYGRSVGEWCQKAWEESLKGATVVMLLPARTDTVWFHEHVYGRAEVRFLKGRLKFLDTDGSECDPAPFPSMVVVYRPSHMRSL